MSEAGVRTTILRLIVGHKPTNFELISIHSRDRVEKSCKTWKFRLETLSLFTNNSTQVIKATKH